VLSAPLLHTYISLDMFPTLAMSPTPPLASSSTPLCEVGLQHLVLLALQVGVSQVSCGWGPTCSRTPSVFMFLLNDSTGTDPHVPPTNTTCSTFHPLTRPTDYTAPEQLLLLFPRSCFSLTSCFSLNSMARNSLKLVHSHHQRLYKVVHRCVFITAGPITKVD
jgi:hypothetical protein